MKKRKKERKKKRKTSENQRARQGVSRRGRSLVRRRSRKPGGPLSPTVCAFEGNKCVIRVKCVRGLLKGCASFKGLRPGAATPRGRGMQAWARRAGKAIQTVRAHQTSCTSRKKSREPPPTEASRTHWLRSSPCKPSGPPPPPSIMSIDTRARKSHKNAALAEAGFGAPLPEIATPLMLMMLANPFSGRKTAQNHRCGSCFGMLLKVLSRARPDPARSGRAAEVP